MNVPDHLIPIDPMLGKTLNGRYALVERLGEGGMGVVYRAERTDGSGEVAIKLLLERLGDDQELKQRFIREAQALDGLRHPNILRILDFGVAENGAPYLVMELLRGEGLDMTTERGELTEADAHEIIRQLLSGLAYAHEQKAVHRDLKSENVYITHDTAGRVTVKLLDFGLVKFMDEGKWGDTPKLTRMGMVFGTPAYMSPEQASGAPADLRTDVYSIGVIIYEVLTGVWPFMEEDQVSMLQAHIAKPVPPLSEAGEDTYQHALELFIQKSLAKKRDDRYQDATEMLRAFEAIPRPLYRGGSLPLPRNSSRPPPAIAPADAPAGGLAPPSVPPVGKQPGDEKVRNTWMVAGVLSLLALVAVLAAVGLAIYVFVLE